MCELIGKVWTLPWVNVLALMMSIIALYITLHDRRARLTLRARHGHWCVLESGTPIMFAGIIEAYNLSSRATALQQYFFWEQTASGEWREMESEYYQETETQGGERIASHASNTTPLTIAPYSGVELRLRAMTALSQPRSMRVRVEVEDIFGKRHRVEVTATP